MVVLLPIYHPYWGKAKPKKILHEEKGLHIILGKFI